jgi:hypothetical protein
MNAAVGSVQAHSGQAHDGAPATRRGRDPRRPRDNRNGLLRVLIVTAFFIIVLGANLFIGGVVLVGGLHDNGIGKYRIGRVTFPLLDGTFCRHILFDNVTAQALEDKVSECGDEIVPPRPGRRTRFNWGE